MKRNQQQNHNQTKQQECIECKDKPARYWGSYFCEECFIKVLQNKIREDDK